MKTLLAVDGSKESEFAEGVLARFPFKEPVDLQIMTVCPSADLHALGADVPPIVNTMVDQCRNASNELLAGIKQRCGEWARSVETYLMDGHAAHEILSLIDQSHPELAVVGSHGYGLTKRFLLGSVSDRVASHAHCPVLVTRSHAEPPDVKTILIADDGSEKAEAAIQRFAKFPLGEDRKVILVSVLETIGTYGMDDVLLSSPEWEKHQRDTTQRLQQHVNILKLATPNVSTLVLEANSVADALANVAVEQSADLIVVGSTGKSGLRKFLLGSVSQRVLHHSPCSVWIERH